ncbi:sulfotransferase family 2 domain-containing protein [Flexibacterium corallicola]|uniref:sulfotransferase family 2 domain-containing protein n=1 Tax=Flexibacterium corallicola TaxID=3037259 RepID=UPI00286EFD63|nr:sulfotransferase family 2 domain-containing protein [Pseudovibrio sp. M1P-2-3]
MPIPILNTGAFYYSVPKVASTSIKTALHLFNMGSGETTKERGIHKIYPARIVRPDQPVPLDGTQKIAILRDPLERLLSCYSNKVNSHKYLGRKLSNNDVHEDYGLPYNPKVNLFILQLPEYCLASQPLTHHASSFRWFLGNDLSRFDYIFTMENLGEFKEFFQDLTEQKLELPWLLKVKTKSTVEDLSKRALKAALRFCRHDYEFLKDYYSPERYGGIPDGDLEDPSSLLTPYEVYRSHYINPQARQRFNNLWKSSVKPEAL